MGEAMELGLFQLENLFSAPNNFMFIDIRVERQPAHPNVDRLLEKAAAVARADVQKYLIEQKAPKGKPIVLVCGDGKNSAHVARDLETAGFEQIYVVAGGVKGLVSEA